MMPVTYQGRDYEVTLTSKQKPGLVGFAIDGKDRGNFRVESDAYRYGMAENAMRFPLSMSEMEVAEQCALAWLHEQDEKKNR
jgi:hypothetical protein